MISETSSSLSGAPASVRRVEAPEKNTANPSTDDLKKDTVIKSEGETGDVVVHIEKSLIPGPQLPEPDVELVERSNVEPAKEANRQIRAEADLEANPETPETTDEMEESIIDLYA